MNDGLNSMICLNRILINQLIITSLVVAHSDKTYSISVNELKISINH